MGCFHSKKLRQVPGYENPTILASETPFTVSEVEALYELFKKISSSIFDDGLIHKEEFQLALFRNRNRRNLFADRIFDLFDCKRNGVIEYGEFVRSLAVFHPNAPTADKVAFAFRLYDLRHTGYIERDELYEMVLALLDESDLVFPDDVVEMIVDKTFSDADTKGDGRIDPEEWKEFVSKNPSLIKNMTLPYLKDITLAFPSFVLNTEVDDSEIGLVNIHQGQSCQIDYIENSNSCAPLAFQAISCTKLLFTSGHEDDFEDIEDVDDDGPSSATFEGGLRIPETIFSKFFDYQRVGIQWLWELYCQRAGRIIGDEMGLGKTTHILAFLGSLHFSSMYKPSIVICPITLLRQWKKEAMKWYARFHVKILHDSAQEMISRKKRSKSNESD
ncbi:unnamed protein product [Fraxinus pennsylvanica]|uniref:Calcineurin B-like protein n=1 Tax=Fraxinus pennsylvanica TaxID=56036 RepID=A0AAD1Z560_9LAMI|nr:unnamed protein product [Fraxinus pennsylvanica]